MISKPPGIPGHPPLPRPLFNFPRVLSGRLSATRPLGCTVGWFRGRLLWTTSQAARGPAWGDGPGSRTRREGGSEGAGVGAQPGPQLGTPRRPPTSGPGCPGCGNGGQGARLAKGSLRVRGSCRKLLGPSCPAQEVPPQMLFLRVRPEIQDCLALPPCGPFSERAGVPATPSPPPHRRPRPFQPSLRVFIICGSLCRSSGWGQPTWV